MDEEDCDGIPEEYCAKVWDTKLEDVADNEGLSATIMKMVGVLPQPQDVTFAVSQSAVWRIKVKHSDGDPYVLVHV